MGWRIMAGDLKRVFRYNETVAYIWDDGRVMREREGSIVNHYDEICRITPSGEIVKDCGTFRTVHFGRICENGAVLDENNRTVYWIHGDGSIRDTYDNGMMFQLSKKLGEIMIDGASSGFIGKVLMGLNASRTGGTDAGKAQGGSGVGPVKRYEPVKMSKEEHYSAGTDGLRAAAVVGFAALFFFCIGFTFLGVIGVFAAVGCLISATAHWGSM